MKLLELEWLKLKNYKAFWILIGLFAGFVFSVELRNYARCCFHAKWASKSFLKTYSFPEVWGNMGYVYSWFVIFLSVFAIISISNEYSFKTHRQHIIDGLSRLDFLHAKAYMVLSISIVATLFYTIITLIFGLMNGGGNPVDGMDKIAFVFIYTLNYISFAALIAFFVRRSGLSIILLFAYFMLESAISSIINWKFSTAYGNLLPLQSSDELLPLNAFKSLSNLTGFSSPEVPSSILLIASILYIILYYFIVRRKMLRADL